MMLDNPMDRALFQPSTLSSELRSFAISRDNGNVRVFFGKNITMHILGYGNRAKTVYGSVSPQR